MTHCPRCGKTNPADIHTCTPPLALRLADALEGSALRIDNEAAAMLRKLYVHNTELENSLIKKSIAIQKIWKERDDLRQQKVADEALLRQALEALEYAQGGNTWCGHQCREAIAAIKGRLK